MKTREPKPFTRAALATPDGFFFAGQALPGIWLHGRHCGRKL